MPHRIAESASARNADLRIAFRFLAGRWRTHNVVRQGGFCQKHTNYEPFRTNHAKFGLDWSFFLIVFGLEGTTTDDAAAARSQWNAAGRFCRQVDWAGFSGFVAMATQRGLEQPSG